MMNAHYARLWSQNGGYEGLAAPILPQAQDGVLDVANVGGVVQVRVPRYTDYRSNDSFIVLQDDAPAPTASPSDVDRGEDITLTVPAWAFSDGPLTLRYSVTDAAGNGALSPPMQVVVSGAASVWLEPPTFPDFGAAVATSQEVARAGGVTVRAPCNALKVGEGITMMWEGYTNIWTPVRDMARVLLSRQVTAADMAAGYIDAFAGMADVLAAGDGGHCVARYFINQPEGVSEAVAAAAPAAVPRAPGGVDAVSGISRPAVLLLDAAEPFILASATSGAPYRTKERPHLAPANRVWIATQPRRTILLSVDQGVVFADNDSDELMLRTDDAGLATADIYYLLRGGKPAPVTCRVTVVDDEADALVVRVASTFAGAYRVDSSGLMVYGCRATAVAGANDFCQISVVMPIALRTVDVTASGSALVRGYDGFVRSLTHNDNTCTITITNDVAETAIITLDSEECHADIQVIFNRTPFSV